MILRLLRLGRCGVTLGLVLAALTTALPIAAMAQATSPPATAPSVTHPAQGRDYLAEARASFTATNRAYSGARVVVRLLGPLYGIVAVLLVMFTGLSVRFRDIAEGLGHTRYVRVLVYFALYSTTLFLLGLPLAWYSEFALQHQYGLSTQSFSGWLLDAVKAELVSIVAIGVIPLLALAWRAIEAQPRRWWLWLAAGTFPVALIVTLAEPLVFDPLFNKFTPLQDATLRTEILALAARAGIPARHVFQVDMSAKTRTLNAYVNGFGASQRIVVWDTTLQRMKRDEILFVMGHEMGHYALRHTWKLLALMGAGAFVVFWLCARLVEGLLELFGGTWGVRGVRDLAAMPVLGLSLTLVMLIAAPASNALSRQAEHEADIFGLEVTRDNDAGARAFLKLAQDNRADPEPPAWVRVLLLDHPPLAERIRFALAYRPWEHGEPNRLFRPAAR
jgi:STE24 endopeptidase